jgi:hypothetical protein
MIIMKDYKRKDTITKILHRRKKSTLLKNIEFFRLHKNSKIYTHKVFNSSTRFFQLLMRDFL